MFRSLTLRMALLLSLLFVSSLALAAETGKRADDQSPKAEAGKALVVFMRPSWYGRGVAASVYDAPDGDTKFIGIVHHNHKVAYQAEPGFHRFMVIAENADFMDANLEAGKTYYVLVSPRPGMWKARFSLLPIRNATSGAESIHSAEFKEWNDKTYFVQSTDSNRQWFDKSKASIEEKKADYLVKWNRMLASDRAELTLHPHDGVPAQASTAEGTAVAGSTGAAPESPATNAAPADAAAEPAATGAAPAAPGSGN